MAGQEHRFDKAIRLLNAGRDEEAVALLAATLASAPGDPDGLHLLGVALCRLGEFEEGVSFIESATRLAPDEAGFFASLATARRNAGDAAGAAEACRKALALGAEGPGLRLTLGRALMEAGDYPAAQNEFSLAVEMEPDNASLRRWLGLALEGRGDHAGAVRELGLAARLDPRNARVQLALGDALAGAADSTRAMAAYEKALELDGGLAEAWINLAMLHKERGDIGAAEEAYDEAIEARPGDARAESLRIFVSHYHEEEDQQAYLRQARRFSARRESGLPRLAGASRPRGGRLRVGYLSGDFRAHAVGFFLEPVLAAHHEQSVAVHVYSNNPEDDEATLRMRGLVERWRDIKHLSDEQAADLMVRDRLDLLIDLSGHTANNRALVVARKPAPAIALWLGYFNSTGLRAVDWIMADATAIPPGSEIHYTERPWRLPDSVFCYPPPALEVAPAPPPSLERGSFSFGCFGDPAKINPRLARLWAGIVARVPGSRLVLKSASFADPAVRQAFETRFRHAGLPEESLDLYPASPHAEYYRAWQGIDLALDSFPYNGGTVTADALWMGVPVLTLAGKRFASRMGASILTACGLPQLITQSEEAYADAAVTLASNPERLAELRHDLRPQLLNSPFCDMKRFVGNLEAAYRAMAAQA